MDRIELKAVKRAKRKAARTGDAESLVLCAVSLLERSIACNHRRLAVIRLVDAVEKGATLTAQQIAYCERVAFASRDTDLKDMVRHVRQLLKR